MSVSSVKVLLSLHFITKFPKLKLPLSVDYHQRELHAGSVANCDTQPSSLDPVTYVDDRIVIINDLQKCRSTMAHISLRTPSVIPKMEPFLPTIIP